MIRRRVHRTDEGQVLIIALLVVLIAGFVMVAIMDYSGAGIRASGTIRDVRDVQNFSAAAVDGAINSIRGSSLDGSVDLGPNGCGPFNPPSFQGASITNPVTVSVTCQPQAGSGSDPSQPPFAVITTSTANNSLNITGTKALTVDGGVFSNGGISIDTAHNAALNVFGDVFAAGPCSTGVTATGTYHCPATAGDPSLPGFTAYSPDLAMTGGATPPISASWPADPLGTCKTSTSVVHFVPGYYSQVPQPDPRTQAVAPGVGCANQIAHPNGQVWWFDAASDASPGAVGKYYFDFPDSGYTGTGFSDADAAWAYNKTTVIGGVPLGGWGDATDSSAVPAAGSACDRSLPGVQFMFGGPSGLTMFQSSAAEVCAPIPDGAPTSSGQRISLFAVDNASLDAAASSNAAKGHADDLLSPGYEGSAGLVTNAGGPTARPASTSAAFAPTAVSTPAPWVTAADPDGGRVIDGQSVTAPLVGGVTTTATATMSGIGSSVSGVPDGSLIEKVLVNVAHAEGGGAGSKVNPSITVTTSKGNTSFPLTNHAALTTDPNIDVTSAFASGSTATMSRWRDLAGTTIAFKEDGSGLAAASKKQPADTTTVSLDGISLVVTYVPPAFESTRCPASTPGCLFMDNRVQQTLLFRGTGFAPTADMSTAVFNAQSMIFARGVIAHALTASVSASSKQITAPFQLPNKGGQRVVTFTASVAGKPTLIATVEYDDATVDTSGGSLAFPGYVVRIRSWAVQR